MELHLLQIMPQNAGAVHMSVHKGLRQSILSCACMQHSYLQTVIQEFNQSFITNEAFFYTFYAQTSKTNCLCMMRPSPSKWRYKQTKLFYWATETPNKCLESPLHSAEVTVYVLFSVTQFCLLLLKENNIKQLQ